MLSGTLRRTSPWRATVLFRSASIARERPLHPPAVFNLALVGLPNAGKSTLFNRLIKENKWKALTHKEAGTTRDVREGRMELGELTFLINDTPGLDVTTLTEGAAVPRQLSEIDTLDSRMSRKATETLLASDMALLMIDAQMGMNAADLAVVRFLHTNNIPMLVVANKCEGLGLSEKGDNTAIQFLCDMAAEGLNDIHVVCISAVHGDGIADLYGSLVDWGRQKAAEQALLYGEAQGFEAPASDTAFSVAVVGRPNVGKSSLLNAMLGVDKFLVGPEAGVTRESVPATLQLKSSISDDDTTEEGATVRDKLTLLDTAGIKRSVTFNHPTHIEKQSQASTWLAVNKAQVIILTAEAGDERLRRTDLDILRRLLDEGRAVVVALNKCDAENPHRPETSSGEKLMLAKELEFEGKVWKHAAERFGLVLGDSVHQVKDVSVMPVSALEGNGFEELLQAVSDTYSRWNRRIPTAHLNQWLAEVRRHHSPPMKGGKPVKIKYLTQTGTRPPTFVAFTNRRKADQVAEEHVAFLRNLLINEFDLKGIPVRLFVRGSDRK